MGVDHFIAARDFGRATVSTFGIGEDYDAGIEFHVSNGKITITALHHPGPGWESYMTYYKASVNEFCKGVMSICKVALRTTASCRWTRSTPTCSLHVQWW